MNGKHWYYAQIRWAVMVEGKEGLRHWEEAVHIFLSDDGDAAFQRAIEIGHQAERSHVGGKLVAHEGLDVVDKIAAVGTGAANRPVKNVTFSISQIK